MKSPALYLALALRLLSRTAFAQTPRDVSEEAGDIFSNLDSITELPRLSSISAPRNTWTSVADSLIWSPRDDRPSLQHPSAAGDPALPSSRSRLIQQVPEGGTAPAEGTAATAAEGEANTRLSHGASRRWSGLQDLAQQQQNAEQVRGREQRAPHRRYGRIYCGGNSGMAAATMDELRERAVLLVELRGLPVHDIQHQIHFIPPPTARTRAFRDHVIYVSRGSRSSRVMPWLFRDISMPDYRVIFASYRTLLNPYDTQRPVGVLQGPRSIYSAVALPNIDDERLQPVFLGQFTVLSELARRHL
ncbi:uncharacterized protein PFL1_04672 [Pseudozyma flocculosa PF-1]|uniref:Uncharacterized protein n=1 Tax=Pseudozyma flocculosa PF-1 TaxID=1277687 RepID=A0A061H5N5_9BASI|nr:uncharacterized protein PFL1_04672 [Pseudozyma flocculosa PF-1]EPQ27928.1 hypothetical protein PFL1_04672 [Pseudozyma flocculosa PF-1]